jgi:flagellar basal-body rod protein FlgB
MTYPVNTNLAYKQILQAHDSQQQLTAQNIANANTPGYQAVEVNLGETFSRILNAERKRIPMSRTSVMHIGDSKFGSSAINVSRVLGEEKPNGNNVNLAEETLRASKNEVDRSVALKEYDALNRLVTLSIGSRG